LSDLLLIRSLQKIDLLIIRSLKKSDRSLNRSFALSKRAKSKNEQKMSDFPNRSFFSQKKERSLIFKMSNCPTLI